MLRVLPGWYRAEREEEMVGLFLADRDDELDLEHGWPGWGEAAATLGLAVRVRLGARRPAGELVRLVGLTGLVAQLAMVGQVASAVLLAGAPVQVAWWADVPVVVAFAALVAGYRAVGRVAAAVTGVLAAAPWVFAVASGMSWWWTALFALPVWITAAAVVVGFHAEAPRPSSRWWAPAVAGVVVGSVVWQTWSPAAVWLSWLSFLWAWVVAAAVVAVFRPWRAARRRAPAGG
ncbi:hypothetical protein GCM10009634_32580 [Saccharothrix xinjiangensis]